MGISLYTVHPLARTMPDLSEEDFSALKESIKRHGYQLASPPIVLWRHQIVDGRHRERALEELSDEGVEIRGQYMDLDLPDEDAVKLWIIDQHLGRRNLTDNQRAALVSERCDLVAGMNQHTVPPHGGTSIREAANKAGVSPRAVERANRVRKADPELHEQVKRGEVTVGKAERIVREREGKLPPPRTPTSATFADQIERKAAKEADAATELEELAKRISALPSEDRRALLSGVYSQHPEDFPLIPEYVMKSAAAQ